MNKVMMNNQYGNRRKIVSHFIIRNIKAVLASLAMMLISVCCFSATAGNIGEVASNLSSSLGAVGTMLATASYVIGIGMFMVAVFQLKQHKENPTQTPLSKPMLFFVVAASLLFMPTLMGVSAGSLFGTGAKTASGGQLGLTGAS